MEQEKILGLILSKLENIRVTGDGLTVTII